MRPVLLVLLLVVPLFAGCAQVDGAREQLDSARRELDEARERFDRVKSATIVREELLDVVITPRVDDDDHVRFDINASRGGVAIPRANVTSLPPIAVRADAAAGWVLCDPLSCAVALRPGATVSARASPTADDGCDVTRAAEACTFTMRGARGLVTTALSDVTE